MFGFRGTDKSVISSGLVLYMDAANPQSYISGSTTVYDLAKVGKNTTNEFFNGVLQNGVDYSSNNQGYFIFDGVDANIPLTGVGNNTILTLNEQTINIWVRQRGGSNPIYIMGGNTGNDRNRNFMVYGNQTSFMAYLIGNGSTFSSIWKTSGFPGFGVWFNIACTYDLKIMKMYINGSLVQSNTTTIIPYKASNNTIRVAERTNNGNNLDGDVSNWSIYNRALTSEEVQHNFEALRGRFGI